MNKQLQQLMKSIQEMGDSADLLPMASKVDLLLYAPCPIKLAMKDQIDRIIDRYKERNVQIDMHIPMGCTSIDPYDPLYRETDIEKLPGIIASIGFGDFWKKEFVDRFVRTGVFEAVLPSAINPMFQEAGMIDPQGCYTIYGVTPYIFLVDTRRLGDIPVPRTWADLFDPRYRREIVMCGDGDDMADAVILNLFKEHGVEGIKRLAANVKQIMHSSKMAKIAGSKDPDAGAIFIIPCFFSDSTTRPSHLQTIWPEDGAAASPLYFLAKKSDKERLADVLSFFTEVYPTIESAAWFVPLGAPSLPQIPANARLKWVGWQFVADNDINRLRDELNLVFRTAQKEAR